MVLVPPTNTKQSSHNHLDSLAHEIKTADNRKDAVDGLLEYFRVLRERDLILPLHTYLLSLRDGTGKNLKDAKERMFLVLRGTFSQMESFITKKRLPKTHIVNTHIRHFRRFNNAHTLDPGYEIMDFGNPHGIELTKTIPDRKCIEGMHLAIMGIFMHLLDSKDGTLFLRGNGIAKESDRDRNSWELSYGKEWFEYDRLYREISKIMVGHPWTYWMQLLEIHFHFQWDLDEYKVITQGLGADEAFWLLYNPTYQHLENAYAGREHLNHHYGPFAIRKAFAIIHSRILSFLENNAVDPATKGSNQRLGGPSSLEAKKWEEIEMGFIDEQTINIFVGRRHGRYTYDQLGFSNSKSSSPNQQWSLLRAISKNESPFVRGTRGAVFKRISLLRESLKNSFKIQEDPFHRYRNREGYTPKFTLFDIGKRNPVRTVRQDGVQYGLDDEEVDPDIASHFAQETSM